MTTKNSALLLREARNRPAAFAEFYGSHFEPVLGFLMRRVFDADVALDLTAETFAQAYVARSRFRGTVTAQAEAWIFRIARRQLSRYLRRGEVERRALQKLGIEVPGLDDERRARVEQLADLEGARSVIRSELAQVSSAQRQALQLRVVDEMTYAEVARQLGITEEAARLRVSRGLRALRTALDANPTMKELPT